MKIAICAQGKGKDAPVDFRFGRCRYFVIVDSEDDTVESFDNPAVGAPGGAGVQAGQFLINQGVDVLLAGNLGPNAASVVHNSGIEVFSGIHGTVADTLNSYEAGELNKATQATVGPHYGSRGGRRRRR